jgi:hypothetical protein
VHITTALPHHLPTISQSRYGRLKFFALSSGSRSHILHRWPNSPDLSRLRRERPEVLCNPIRMPNQPRILIHHLYRGAVCTSCQGRGFNIFICAHCNPAAAATAVRSSNTVASVTANTTPGSSAPSSPGSLSRSPSTSYPTQPDARTSKAWRRYGDGRDSTNCGRVETNTSTPRNL